MIPADAANLATSIARGLIKLGKRLDRLTAENTATGAELVLPLPQFSFSSGINTMIRDFKRLVADSPALIEEADRETIDDNLAPGQADKPTLTPLYRKYFPEKYFVVELDPETEYMKALRKALPDLDLGDEDVRVAAFYVGAGADSREIAYPYRIGLLVVDVVAEFGSENAALFVRDKSVQTVVQAVLERFSRPDLESFTEWSGLARHTLSATLNGLLDARGELKTGEPWVNAILDALVDAREAGGDDYLVGLLRGEGYARLIGETLEEFSGLLDAEKAGPWKRVLSGVLAEAAPLVTAGPPSFREFFNDNWSHLVRASLKGIAREGDAILRDADPLLKTTLVAMVKSLSTQQRLNLLNPDVLVEMVDAAVAAVAEKPELLTADNEEPWLKGLIGSVVNSISQQGVRQAFSGKGLETVLRDTMTAFGRHPEWIIDDPGLAREITGEVLKSIAQSNLRNPEDLAVAVVSGSLGAIEANPALLGTEYPEVVASFAGNLAGKIATKALNAFEAGDVLEAAFATLDENPRLLAALENRLLETIVDGVVEAEVGLDGPGQLLLRGSLVSIMDALMQGFARRGQGLAATPTNELRQRLIAVVQAATERAKEVVGTSIGLPSLPPIVSDLALKIIGEGWPEIDPDSPEFKQLFQELAELHAA